MDDSTSSYHMLYHLKYFTAPFLSKKNFEREKERGNLTILK
jgi:hypothetical protein